MAPHRSTAAQLGAILPAPLIPLFELAHAATARSYAPYSRFQVGAATRLADGRTFVGCNVENVAYSIVTCAERNALAALVLGRTSDEPPTEVALLAESEGTLVPCSPCGACRQAIAELDPECLVHFLYGDPLELVSRPVRDLLPWAFDLA